MLLERLQSLARFDVPDADSCVIAARQQPLDLRITLFIKHLISRHAVDPGLVSFVSLAVSSVEVKSADL